MGDAVNAADPPWLTIARRYLGTKETPGPASNELIERFHASTAGGAAADDVPWCSSFACFCMEAAGITSPRSKRALSWHQWPSELLGKPIVGAIAVFDHGGGKGHVAFVVGVTASKKLVCLGGNQSDAVKLSVYSGEGAWLCWPAPPVLSVAEIAGESTR